MLRQTIFWGLSAACHLSLAAVPAESIEERSFETQAGDTLVVENDYGRVRVTAWDQPEIHVGIRKIVTEKENLQNIYFLSHRNGTRIFLRAFFYEYDSESLYLDIQAPSYMNLVIWGVNPAVETAGISGKVNVHTITGFITAEDLVASSSLATDDGNIQYVSTLQPLEDIRLESFRGNINCVVAPNLNLRSWLRAGRNLNWNNEVQLSAGSLEKQIGVGGPLILATSSEGSVTFNLRDGILSPEDDNLSRTTVSANRRFPEAPSEEAEDDPFPETTNSEADRRQYPTVPLEGDPASGYSLKVNVDWVYVNASVRDRYTNRAVPDLTREDFEVYEAGTLQRIEQFASTEAPFNLLLLLDVSGSTRSYMHLIQEASIQFTQEIKPNDRMAVAVFNSKIRLVQGFTSDRESIRAAIGRIRSGGGTAFYDALDRSIREYMDGVEGRKAVVVFSDGVDNQLTGDFGSGSQTTFADLYREIQEADTLIYTIFLDTEEEQGIGRGGTRSGGLGGILGDIIFGGPTIGIPPLGTDQDQAYAQAKRELELIAEQTGGRMYAPRATRDLAHVYSEIADDLRVQYTLGYYSQDLETSGEWREIEVKIVNHPNLAVRARKGYYGRQG